MEVETLLRDLIHKNRDTEIGKRWKFEEISSLQEYKKQVPLTSYDLYKPYIDRIAEHGEQNLLTRHSVKYLSPSSATTGKMKLIPVIDDLDKKRAFPVMGRIHLYMSTLGYSHESTPSGITVQAKSVDDIRYLREVYHENYTLPAEVYDINKNSSVHTKDIFYVQLLFSIKDASADTLEAVFIHMFLTAFKQLTQRWPQMVNDIETGELDESLSISADEKKCLEARLGGPDPVRADQLRGIFNKGTRNDFREIIPEIWPNVRLIKCLCSGNLSSYVPALQYYAGPGIHVLSHVYISSEGGLIGVPARPLTETSLFKLTPFNFYEFIPLSDSTKDQPDTLLASQVKAGEIYEIVLTTTSGFYRYKSGDYIKIIEQTEDDPLFDFYGRKKMALDLTCIIITENIVDTAMSNYSKTIQSRIDYIIAINEDTYSGFQMWVECDHLLSNASEVLDKNLQQHDTNYTGVRKHNTLDTLVVKQVKVGTFDKIFTYMKSKTVNMEDQLKIPRMIHQDGASQEIKKILIENEY